MKRFIENEVNIDFLEQALERGYRPYVDSMKCSDRVPSYYLGSVQKRITDDHGTRYFININMYDMSAINSNAQTRFTASVDCQITVDSETSKVLDASFSFEDFDSAEKLLDDIWSKMSFDHYERTS